MERLHQMRGVGRLLLPLILPLPGAAHGGELVGPHDLWTAWEVDPLVVAGLAVSAILYSRGAGPKRGVRRWERWCFWAGWVTAFIALVSPLHPLGEVLFSAHMVQHEILMMLSAPLLVLGRPLVPFVWALPAAWRSPVGLALARGWPASVWGWLTLPLVAWLIHFLALWLWHLPSLFQATLASDFVHSLQHMSFLFSALVFWWALLHGHGRRNPGLGVFYLFTTLIHTGVLGALLTLSDRLWYPIYATSTEPWGLTPLEDQQLGGVIMWVPACITYLIGGLALFAYWLRSSDQAFEPAGAQQQSQPAPEASATKTWNGRPLFGVPKEHNLPSD